MSVIGDGTKGKFVKSTDVSRISVAAFGFIIEASPFESLIIAI